MKSWAWRFRLGPFLHFSQDKSVCFSMYVIDRVIFSFWWDQKSLDEFVLIYIVSEIIIYHYRVSTERRVFAFKGDILLLYVMICKWALLREFLCFADVSWSHSNWLSISIVFSWVLIPLRLFLQKVILQILYCVCLSLVHFTILYVFA